MTDPGTEVITLKMSEFALVQDQLNELKTKLFASQEKEQKLQKLGLQWKAKCKAIDEEYSKAKAIIVASKNAKEVARLQKELDQLKSGALTLSSPAAPGTPGGLKETNSAPEEEKLIHVASEEEERDSGGLQLKLLEEALEKERQKVGDLTRENAELRLKGDEALSREAEKVSASEREKSSMIEGKNRAEEIAAAGERERALLARAVEEGRERIASLSEEVSSLREHSKTLLERSINQLELSNFREPGLAPSDGEAREREKTFLLLQSSLQTAREEEEALRGAKALLEEKLHQSLSESKEKAASLLSLSVEREALLKQNESLLVSMKELAAKLAVSEAAHVELGAALKERLQSSSAELESGVSQLARLTESNAGLEREKAHLTELISSLEKEKLRAASLVSDGSKQVEKISGDFRKKSKQLEQSEAEVGRLKTELKSLESEVANLRQEAKENAVRSEKQKSELEKSRSELEKSKSELEKSRSELEKSKSELEKSKSELEKSKSELEKCKHEIDRAKLEAQKRADGWEVEKSEWIKGKSEMKKELASLESLKKKEAEAAALLGKLKGELLAAREDLKREREESKREALSAREMASEREKHLVSSVERAKLEVDRLTDQLKFSGEDKANLLAEKKRQYEKLDSERAEQVSSLEGKLSELSNRLKVKHSAWQEVTGERDELSEELKRTKLSLEELQRETEENRGTKASIQIELNELQGKYKDASDMLLLLSAEHSASASEKESRIKQLETALHDAGLERKVSEKKSVQLIKDLQSQLSKIRNTAASPKPQRFPGGNKSPRSSEAAGESSQASSSSGSKVDMDLLQEENNALIHRITEMQQSRWKMEERIKDLESLNATICEDLAKKQAVIREHVMNSKTGGRRDMQREIHRADSRLSAHAGAPAAEIVAKLEDVLEDTLLKNIQLKTDLEVLGNEVEELRKKYEDAFKMSNRK